MHAANLFLYISLFLSLFFEVFLLITYFEIREEIKFEKDHMSKGITRYPSVSVIVPSYNEELTVEATVHSLLSLDYPKDKLEILLIDDGSKDKTWEVMKKFENHPQIRIFKKENGGKHTALNFGLDNVTTELVGCLDADSFVDSQALKSIIPYFNDPEIMAVAPSLKVHEPQTVLQHVQKVEYSWGVLLRRMLSSLNAMYVTPGPFSIFRIEVFKKLGGYRNAHYGEDMEIAMRMQQNRYRIVNAMHAVVYTVTPPKLKPLYKQRRRWTYSFINNTIDYREFFFNKKYGHLGFFILPLAFASYFTTLYAAGTFLWKMAKGGYKSIIVHNATGWAFHTPHWSFDWYFLNTGMLTVLTIVSIGIMLYLITTGMRLSDGRIQLGKGIVYYMTIYVFIVPLWLASAVWNTVFSKSFTWR